MPMRSEGLCPTPQVPHNHLFSYFHQQPNYWSFKVSVRCFCCHGNCMCPLPASLHMLGTGVCICTGPQVFAMGLGPWAVAAASGTWAHLPGLGTQSGSLGHLCWRCGLQMLCPQVSAAPRGISEQEGCLRFLQL